MKIVKTIIDSEIQYLTVHEKRQAILASIRGKNVAFKDVESFLFKEARREGYYSDESHLNLAREQKLAWLIYLERFIKWVNRTYKAGWQEVKQPIKKSTKEKPVVTVPKALSKPRIEKLLAMPDNVKAISEELEAHHKCIVLPENKITPEQAENLLEYEDNVMALIIALEELGYQVIEPITAAGREIAAIAAN